MANNPAYAATPKNFRATLSAANTARDGTGTIVTLCTGAATGTRIEDIFFKAVATTTAGMIRLFYSLDGGTTNDLIWEIPVTVVPVAINVPAWAWKLSNLGFVLQDTSALLRASTEKAETFKVVGTRAGVF